MARGSNDTAPTLHVLAIGGQHQYPHFLPVAFEIARRGRCEVKIFVPTTEDREPVEHLAADLGLPLPQIVPMVLPSLFERRSPSALHKVLRLLFWANRLRSADAILCGERTSTLLKRLPGHCPPMLHFKHGAGDRAKGFERRLGLFEAVFVQGTKDCERLIAEHIVEAGRCAVVGPVKLEAMLKRQTSRPNLFDNDRPVVLYNPHFNRELGSFDGFTRPIIEAVAAHERFNLIVAPHVRLARNWDADQRAQWERLSVPGRVIVDLGSDRSIDMSYTLAADMYVGDVSSQVYEFIVRPRPCLFVNAHDADWRANEDYMMWRYGDVIEPGCDIAAALELGFVRHVGYRAVQQTGARAAFDGLDWKEDGSPYFAGTPPSPRAADLVEKHLSTDSERDGANLPAPGLTRRNIR